LLLAAPAQLADYFEAVQAALWRLPKLAANWVWATCPALAEQSDLDIEGSRRVQR